MTDTRHMYGGPGFGHYQGFGIGYPGYGMQSTGYPGYGMYGGHPGYGMQGYPDHGIHGGVGGYPGMMVGTAVTQAAAMEALREL